MVTDVRPDNANHMFPAPADPARRAIFAQGWPAGSAMTYQPYQNLTAQSGKDKACKSN
jgi:hypothetical protein